MKYENLYDMHTHSIHSFDGNHKISELLRSASEKNAKGIAITDHCDIDGIDDYDALCRNQISDFKASAVGFDNLTTMLGMEVGQGIYRRKAAEEVYLSYGYDFILGSIHNLENMEDFYFLDYKQFDVKALLERYFSDIAELCRWGYFDSLAHLTYPLRYIIAREHMDIDISEYYELIDEIFSLLIKKDKALEINTSGLFMEMKTTLPDYSLIKRYYDLGGRLITIGSDSHYAERVLQGIEEGMALAASVGFENIAIYKNHKPILISVK